MYNRRWNPLFHTIRGYQNKSHNYLCFFLSPNFFACSVITNSLKNFQGSKFGYIQCQNREVVLGVYGLGFTRPSSKGLGTSYVFKTLEALLFTAFLIYKWFSLFIQADLLFTIYFLILHGHLGTCYLSQTIEIIIPNELCQLR